MRLNPELVQPRVMRSYSFSWRADWLALLAYFLLAIVLTYPLVLHFATHVAGDGSDDPALAWNLWWVRYAIFDLGRSPIYTDYLFFPIGLNLAFYTPTYLNAFISIPIQFALGLVSAANLNLLLSFTLSGFGTYLLVKYLLRDWAHDRAPLQNADTFIPLAAFASGLLYAFSSNKFLYASLGQFNIASSHWIPFYILFLLKTFPTSTYSRTPKPTHAFLLGLFLLFQTLSEFIFGSFLIIFTLAYLIYWLVANRFHSNPKCSILNLLVAAVTFLIPMSPILGAMISDTVTEGDFIQSGSGFANSFSADLVGFFVPSHLHPLLGGLESQFHFAYINFSYLGYIALALAVIALLRVPRARIWGVWFALILLITLGPTLRVNGQEFNAPFLPFNLLLQIPFIKGNRYPSRWSVMLTLCLAVLVGYGIAWLLSQVASRRSQVAGSVLPAACGLGLGALLLFEHLSLPLPLSDFRIPEIYNQIAHDPGDLTVMELPLAWRNGFRVTGSYRADSQAPIDRSFMLAQWYQTAQHHRILNGNTSRNPELKFQYFSESPVLDDIIAIQEGHDVDAAARARDQALAPRVLQFFGTRYVIWHTPYEDVNRDVANKTRSFVEEIFPMTKISESYENGRGTVVYRVNTLPASHTIDIKPDDPLARLYFGEGWGAIGGESFVAQRQEVKIFLPLTTVQNIQLTSRKLKSYTYLSEPPELTLLANGIDVGHYDYPQDVSSPLTTSLPASALKSGMNEITFVFDNLTGSFFLDPRVSIGQTNVASYVPIVVRSAGEEQGNFGHIYVSGVDESLNARGYNVVVIDPASGKVEARANFDTFADTAGEESARMAQFIAQIPNGKIVAVAVRDEASNHLTQEAVDAFKTIGAKEDLSGKFRWSHAIIGVKGAAPGTAMEAASETHVSQLIVGIGATEPDIAASLGEIRIEPAP